MYFFLMLSRIFYIIIWIRLGESVGEVMRDVLDMVGYVVGIVWNVFKICKVLYFFFLFIFVILKNVL